MHCKRQWKDENVLENFKGVETQKSLYPMVCSELKISQPMHQWQHK